MAVTETLSYEKVWEIVKENSLQLKETREQMKETDRKFQETREQMKETDRLIGKLGNRFGEMVEHLVAPGIKVKFNRLGFTFEQMSQNIEITGSDGKLLAEIDIMLENGDFVIAVEVKSKPKDTDVDDFIRKMEVLRRRADKRNDTRKFRGAIAAAIMNENTRNKILKSGFYPIEQSGDTVMINIPDGFIPREW